MGKIISFNNTDDNPFCFTTEDLFNLFLISKQKEETLAMFDSAVLMRSFAKYRNLEKFSSIYKEIVVSKDESGNEIVDLTEFLEKKKQQRVIIEDPRNKNQMLILGSEEEFETLASNYSKGVLSSFNNLMFYINNDLKFGIGKWSIFAEDELINVPRYPSFVTGEFINQDKSSPLVQKKIKQRAKENAKNLYQ